MTKIAIALRPTWQDIINALRKAGSLAEAEYMEELRDAAKNPAVTVAELTQMLRPLEPQP